MAPTEEVMQTLFATSTCRVASAYDQVLNSECGYTFHSPYTTDRGILVNLDSFLGTVQELALLHNSSSKAVFVRIVKKRVEKEVAPGKPASIIHPTKLGLGVEDGGFPTDEDQYETISTHSVVLLEKLKDDAVSVRAELPYNDDTKHSFPPHVSLSVDSILFHAGISTQQDVKVWQLDTSDIPVSKYANENLPFLDNGVLIDPDPTSWKCQLDPSHVQNLWLNLSDGYIGGGRRNWDGSGGSGGALEHFQRTGHVFPLVVKLGTITADLETADCYSYAPDEDGPVRIPNLAELLRKRGIQVADMYV
jgi:ubiquitin carboxyl-terminal hydrolase 5/13